MTYNQDINGFLLAGVGGFVLNGLVLSDRLPYHTKALPNPRVSLI
jgi:hypothetical protein